MKRIASFEVFSINLQQQNNITGGNTRIPQTEAPTLQEVVPQIVPQLTSSVNTWSNETTFITGNTTTRGRG